MGYTQSGRDGRLPQRSQAAGSQQENRGRARVGGAWTAEKFSRMVPLRLADADFRVRVGRLESKARVLRAIWQLLCFAAAPSRSTGRQNHGSRSPRIVRSVALKHRAPVYSCPRLFAPPPLQIARMLSGMQYRGLIELGRPGKIRSRFQVRRFCLWWE